ncbi:MAG: pilus assembly protein PilB, partial [Planctomycetes bacterium]|nr:pilus assembly protein PilB [Planctomycetota bacterium]
NCSLHKVILIELGKVTAQDVEVGLAGQFGLEYVDLGDLEIPKEVIAALQPATANSYKVLPIAFDPATRSLTIAMKNRDNYRAVDDLKNVMGFSEVKSVIASAEQIEAAVAKYYGGKSMADAGRRILAEQDSAAVKAAAGRSNASIDLTTLGDAMSDNKVVELLNHLLMQAIADKASDIHMEPFESEFKVRYRIDGVLYEMLPVPKPLAMPLVSRVKVLAKLNISERRLPQDGRVEMSLDSGPVDLRVAVLPTMFGESVVLRVLDRSNVQLSLDRIGLRDDDLEKLRTLINKPNGIVIVTGPTGSGKTTSLYAALNELNDIETKILTAEDPVEYDIEGLIQCQVNVDQELTFARLLRSFLRQDPDIILVGEVRDLETAQIAIQAALTGHLVFTTLHTNDAPSSIARLLDLGVESFLLTATLEAIVAQRLARRICTNCKEEFIPSEEQLMELAMRPQDVGGRTFFRGRGCERCNKSGYKGRLALFEIMVMTDPLRELIMSQASTSVLGHECRRHGMRTLRECGLLSIYDGQTTIDEVVRETLSEE